MWEVAQKVADEDVYYDQLCIEKRLRVKTFFYKQLFCSALYLQWRLSTLRYE